MEFRISVTLPGFSRFLINLSRGSPGPSALDQPGLINNATPAFARDGMIQPEMAWIDIIRHSQFENRNLALGIQQFVIPRLRIRQRQR